MCQDKRTGARAVNCETVGLSGQVHFSVKFQFLVIKMFFLSGTGEDFFLMENFLTNLLLDRQSGGQRAPPASIVS